ncbi:MAG: AmmeMemoRadiSam system protein A [Phycisphaerales bacterium]|nr:MAG: AmmeMemoRadiSam system protein A [Phycisphaerales bacterium]
MSTLRRIESAEHKKVLLKLARESASAALGSKCVDTTTVPRIEGTFGGAFVTFWAGKRLRGCIGSFARTDDITSTVKEVAISSLADRRFESNPITAEELPTLDIEISVLSDLEPTSNPEVLIPGVHGIMIRRGARTGCFLPKVALEYGWTTEEFLSNCCATKAGLSADAWRQKDTEVFLFTADVFSESRLSP